MIDENLKEFILFFSNNKPIDQITVIDKKSLKPNIDLDTFLNEYCTIFEVNIPKSLMEEYTTEVRVLTVADLRKGIETGSLDTYTTETDIYEENFRPEFTAKKIILGIVISIIATCFLCWVSIYF